MSNTDRARLLLLFSMMGASAALLPALIPASTERFGLADFSLLSAVPLMFGGLFLGVLFSPLLNLRFRLDLLIRLAALVMALGLIGLFLAQSENHFLISSAVLGYGFGALEVSITAAIRSGGQDATRDLTKLNLFFAASAMTAPLLLLAELSLFETSFLLLITALISAASVVGLGTIDLRQGRPDLRGTGGVAPLVIAALFYVGAESVLAGWSSTLVAELLVLSAAQAAVGSSAFWALIALGRWVSLLLTPKLIPNRLAPIFWSSLAALALVIAGSLDSTPALALFGLAIFAAGPIYALLVGRVLELMPSTNASATTAAVIVVGAAGGFLIPALLQLDPGVSQAARVAGLSFLLVAVLSFLGLRSKTKQPEESLA